MKNIEIRDLMEIRFPSNPLMSPDGAHTAYVVSKQNERENRYESWLWLLDNATGASRQLTFSGKEADFVWEDGRTLLFATERGEADKPEKFQKKTCFYRLPVDGGEARKAFEVPLNVAAIRPLGDGKYLVNAVVDLNEPPEDMDETLRGDSLRVNQVLMNLLSNALKFTPRGGKITLRVTRLHEEEAKLWLKFEVSDTGCGIAPENYGRIFQAFEQESASVSQNYGGTGLGLSISKRFTEMMGGKISVSSRLGKGTTFSVVLPFGRVEQEADRERNFAGMTALVADDDPDAVAHARLLLEKLGVRVDVTDNGYEAAAKAEQAQAAETPYDLCLIDWKMPFIDGLETIRRIREGAAGRKPAAVLMTAYDTAEIKEESRRAGAFSIITKPLFESTLSALLSAISGNGGKEETDSVVPAGDFRGRRFLVVEDNELNREIAVGLLEATGAQIETAENGKEAVEKFDRSLPGYFDLILMDVQMPVMNGYEATKAIRALKRRDAGSIPILAMTANAFSEDVEKSLASGMNGHISKPIDLKEVFDKIASALLTTPRTDDIFLSGQNDN